MDFEKEFFRLKHQTETAWSDYLMLAMKDMNGLTTEDSYLRREKCVVCVLQHVIIIVYVQKINQYAKSSLIGKTVLMILITI